LMSVPQASSQSMRCKFRTSSAEKRVDVVVRVAVVDVAVDVVEVDVNVDVAVDVLVDVYVDALEVVVAVCVVVILVVVFVDVDVEVPAAVCVDVLEVVVTVVVVPMVVVVAEVLLVIVFVVVVFVLVATSRNTLLSSPLCCHHTSTCLVVVVVVGVLVILPWKQSLDGTRVKSLCTLAFISAEPRATHDPAAEQVTDLHTASPNSMQRLSASARESKTRRSRPAKPMAYLSRCIAHSQALAPPVATCSVLVLDFTAGVVLVDGGGLVAVSAWKQLPSGT